MAPAAEEAVRHLADSINRGDVESALEVCHPEIEFLSVLAVSGRAYQGHDGMRQYFADVAAAWSEWKVEVHLTATAPDGRVVIDMNMHFRGKESGAAFSDRMAHVWTTKEGNLLRNEPYRDSLEALRAVGAMP